MEGNAPRNDRQNDINSTGTNASFTDDRGGTDVNLVDGGSLGGTGTINITGGDNVSLREGGALTAGLAGTAGKTTIQFDGGNLDLTTATASANTGWLRFDLGSDVVAGTNPPLKVNQKEVRGAGWHHHIRNLEYVFSS